MILKPGHSTQYLQDYKDGKIQQGLGIGCPLDDHIRYKQKQLNLILGHDNVGKTFWMWWYFLCINHIHGKKCLMWIGENEVGQAMRTLITFLSGKYIKDLTYKEITKCEKYLEDRFLFLSNANLYTPERILDIIDKTKIDYAFIDPLTGLDRDMTHEGNYRFLNNARLLCNQSEKSIYISTHPTSESGRTSMLYPKDHEWAGHLRAPLKAHVEGGKPYLNRCDDMFIIHRLTQHHTMKYFTMVEIAKIKNKDTGGEPTMLNEPLLFEFNRGKGFTYGGFNPIQKTKKEIDTLNNYSNGILNFNNNDSTL